MVSNPSDSEIADLLLGTKTIAVVGASPDPFRPSHDVMAFLIGKGYRVFPVNPQAAGQEIHGRKVVVSLADIDEPIDMVDCFRRSEFIGPVVDEALEVGAKSIWMQLGVVNEPAAEKARGAGLQVVMDRCPVIEWRRLGLGSGLNAGVGA